MLFHLCNSYLCIVSLLGWNYKFWIVYPQREEQRLNGFPPMGVVVQRFDCTIPQNTCTRCSCLLLCMHFMKIWSFSCSAMMFHSASNIKHDSKKKCNQIVVVGLSWYKKYKQKMLKIAGSLSAFSYCVELPGVSLLGFTNKSLNVVLE